MKWNRYSCAACRAPLAIGLSDGQRRCPRCGVLNELAPAFLRTLSARGLFFSGALWLGLHLHDPALGLEGAWRLVFDLGVAVTYYWLCRALFSFFQHTVRATGPAADGPNDPFH